MKIAAVICEFNPFHSGHAHLLSELREKHGADYIIALMSGNYVQRGEPAIFDKYVRARMALTGDGGSCENDGGNTFESDNNCGGGHVDLVLELPPVFAMSSAREFAAAGVRLADSTGIADMLGFGVEGKLCADESAAGYKYEYEYAHEPDALQNEKIKTLLRSGLSYPAAVSETLGKPREASAPNNILASEYLLALRRFNSHIEPVPIMRSGNRYNDGTLPVVNIAQQAYASASAIRKAVFSASGPDLALDRISPFVPPALHDIYRAALPSPFQADELSDILNIRLLSLAYEDSGSIYDYLDISREIGDRLMNTADRHMTFTERTSAVKTKQYTYSRISRSLLHAALGVTKSEAEALKAIGYVKYIRVLGFRRDAEPLMKLLKQNAKLPVITKTADYKELLKRDIYFDQIYYSVKKTTGEYSRSPMIV